MKYEDFPPLTEDEVTEIRQRVHRWRGDYEHLVAPDPFEELRATPKEFAALERRDVPTLHLEDVSAIPFVGAVPGIGLYQHRARVRAFSGDLFAAVSPMLEGYEEYCRAYLGLGEPELLLAEPTDGPMAVTTACCDGPAFDTLVTWARKNPTIAVHPYMAIQEVWELAQRLHEVTGTRAFVVGPPTPALWVANDKWALTEVVNLVLGDDWHVETVREWKPEPLARRLSEFARRHEKVGLKRTRCASAMGNSVYDAELIRHLEPRVVVEEVTSFLEETEWEGDEEVLVVEWAVTDISPSTQLWIPPKGAGAPRLDGVFEQLLEGPEKVFVGSCPSTLPEPVNRALGEASLRLAVAFQELGYVGRCSFDFVITGDLEGDFRAMVTECNGRWGGTSTPMFLVDRLVGGARPHYLAQDWVHQDLVGASFTEVHAALEPELYDPRTGRGRFVLYNVGPLTTNGKFDVVSIGSTSDQAVEGVTEVIPRLLGLL